MTRIARSRTAFSLALLPLLAGTAFAQQELYVLGRFNKIWRVDNYTSATPTRTEIVTWNSNSTVPEPVGLEIDPLSGDFWVLTSAWTEFNGLVSELSRVDPLTGNGVVEMTIPADMMRGLDRRWDGKLYTVRNHTELWLLDPAQGSWTVETLSAPVGEFWAPLAVDERGMLLGESGDLLTIDPFSGAVTSVGPAMPASIELGLEIDADGSIYVVGLAADLWRLDPGAVAWTQLFPSWNEMSNGYDLAFTEVVDGSGFAEVCNGLPNTSGSASTLELLGQGTVGANDLELVARQLPANVFGYFLMSDNSTSLPVGQGILCLGSTVHRYNQFVLFTGPEGEVRFPLDLHLMADGQPAMVGDTQLFQLWHRDHLGGFGTSNFSAAASVTFQ